MKACGDFRFAFCVFGECPVALPCFHGGSLHGFICGFAFRACAREREQDRLAEIQTFGQGEILRHSIRINLQLFDHVTQFREHVIEQDAGVGENDALGARVADVALVPERDVFQRDTALPRITRARPLNRSHVIGLRLCGMAELPFWPSPNNSSTSSTSVRWRWRNSVAQRSMLEAMRASVVMNSAWRSRCTICVESVAGFNPSFSHTARSIFGSICACVPTAPLIFPTRIRSRVLRERSSALPKFVVHQRQL